MYRPTSPEIAARRKEFAPHVHEAFEAFSKAVFADGALPEQTKQLIAVAHTTQCPYCIRGHTLMAIATINVWNRLAVATHQQLPDINSAT